MKHKKLNDALNEVSDKYLEEAAAGGKRKAPYYLSAIAAVLAVVLLVGLGAGPFMQQFNPTPSLSAPNTTPPYTIPPYNGPDPFHGEKTPVSIGSVDSPYLLCAPVYPQMAGYNTNNYWNSKKEIHATQKGYADSLQTYFDGIMRESLISAEENAVLSPVNIYLALAMLAETAGGNSRQQILDLMGLDSIEALREQAEQVWRVNYWNDGLSTSVLASSLWLSDSLSYNESVVKTLAESYYASVFRGEMGSSELNSTLQDWLNKSTGDLLSDYVKDVKLSADTVMSLATTIYYQVEWQDVLGMGTEEIFYTPSGEKTVPFIRSRDRGGYYWGENYSAASLSLKNGDIMWLILPDQGKTPADLLSEGKAVRELLDRTGQKQSMIVNLSMPKFDISAKSNLRSALQNLGVTEVFSPLLADFSEMIPSSNNVRNPYVDTIEHAARVSVDEEGVTAAAYTLIVLYGAAAPDPNQQEIEFVLDRPFLFVVENDGMPLFTGIVNNP